MPAPEVKWRNFAAAELFDQISEGDGLDMLQEEPAIYMWRLSLEPTCHPEDAKGVMDQFERVARLPQGEQKDIGVGRMVRIKSLELGGVPLPEVKRAHLREFVTGPDNSRFAHGFLKALEVTLPALYCGETDNLRRRAKEHLTTNTKINQLVKSPDNELSWEDLRLDFFYLDDTDTMSMSENQRKAFEYFTGIMCVAAFTERLG